MSVAVQQPSIILDPTDKFRPEYKDAKEFRIYGDDNEHFDRVKRTYMLQHTNQSLKYVLERKAHWKKFNHCKMTIMEAIDALDLVVDESDPDIDLPNSVHAYQTAEAVRIGHPDKDWFHLIGLVHDLGKIMTLYGEPQWSMTCDTYPVGCAFSDKILFGKDSFKDNPDFNHEVYSTKLGIYEENCGLDKVNLAWAHDEYMYQVLVHNGAKLPKEGLDMIRFHSFFPWHNSQEYSYLCNEDDISKMKWSKEFSKYDIYSKSPNIPNVEELKPYYQSLIDKYIPGVLEW